MAHTTDPTRTPQSYVCQSALTSAALLTAAQNQHAHSRPLRPGYYAFPAANITHLTKKKMQPPYLITPALGGPVGCHFATLAVCLAASGKASTGPVLFAAITSRTCI
jgi:hypothetical protein